MKNNDKSLWPKKLYNHNKNIYENILKKKILLENTEAVIQKIKRKSLLVNIRKNKI